MQLLVSVTDPVEARAAIEGGAEIIDAKDATRGALGAVAPSVLRAIVAAVGVARPVSAALGDAGNGDDTRPAGFGLPAFATLAISHGVSSTSSVPMGGAGLALAGVSFVKVGFAAGVTGRGAAAYVRSVVAALAGTETAVVLAAYADAATDRLGRDAVLDLGVACGAAGVLLDTLGKERAEPLFSVLAPDVVADWVGSAHQGGLRVALAGSLGASEIPMARDVGADVVGVRGAACDGGRRGRVSVERVRGLRRQMGVPHQPCGAAGVPTGRGDGAEVREGHRR